MSASQKTKTSLLQLFDRAFGRAVSLKPSEMEPGTVYHYTQATGFAGILEQANLWLTNFSFLNDPYEIEYGRELVLEVLEDEQKSHGDEKKDFLQRLNASFKEQAVSEVYVGCLTKRRDDLSQWRAYGSATGGRYCIGFDLESIYERTREVAGTAFDRVIYNFDRVIYNKDEQRKRVRDLLERTTRFVDEKNLPPPETREIAELAGSRLWELVPRLKASAFAAEEEWRIVRWFPTNEVSEVCFQAKGGNVRPYVQFPLNHKGSTPVVEVIVLAPGREEQAVKAADMLLRKVGIENVSAEKSQIPFADY